ncbi:MAG: hypothetical protein JXR70_13500 [Spirochaetales bacterium]|nr:hypothetical protein [Spirochaetales bacterium]
MNIGVVLGISTLIFLLITAFLGLRTNFFKAKTRLRVHKICALTTVLLALIHGGYILINWYLL